MILMVNPKKTEEMEKKRREMKVPLPITSSAEEFAKQSIKEKIKKMTKIKGIGFEGLAESFADRQASRKYGYTTIDKKRIIELSPKNEALLRKRIPELENLTEIAIVISSIEAQDVIGRTLSDEAKERLAYAYDFLTLKKNVKSKIYVSHPNALIYAGEVMSSIRDVCKGDKL